MSWGAIARLLGILLTLYSVTFLPSLLLSLWYADGEDTHFLVAALGSATAGMLVWFPSRRHIKALKVRDGFLLVTLFWAVLGVVGGIPFLIGLHLGLTDSVFEAVSGFTTTGATVITGLDKLPPSILYHRQQIQWLGGMGVIVLAVAILPVLGVGGMQLYRAEASGITKDDKLTPRIAETARALWALYLGLTMACAIAFWSAGMSPFDAVGHAYTTVATGGFSTHDASIAHYDSLGIELVCIVFMLLGGVNFALHFHGWHRRSVGPYLRDSEFRAYLVLFVLATLFIAITLYVAGPNADAARPLRLAAFQVASVLTSTGFTTANYSEWPLHLPLTLVLISFVGGCAGSTAGGIKVVRIVLLAKIGAWQIYQLSHHRAVALVKLGRRRVPEEVIYSVLGYYSLYLLTSILLTVAMMGAGLDFVSAIGSVTATINLLGPGLGETATTFATVGPVVKWLGVFGMLVGRLEVFTLLILFTPAFWRH